MKPAWHPVVPAFLLGLVIGAASGSWGQRTLFRHHPEMDRRRALERLTRELDLDDAQKTIVAAALDAKRAEVQKLKADTFARLRVIRAVADADIKKVLRPEQSRKLEALGRRRMLRIHWDAPTGI